MVMTWTLRAAPLTSAIGLVCVALHAALFAEVVARSCMAPEKGGSQGGVSGGSAPRSAPVFLVIDTAAVAFVFLHTLQVCGWLHFSNPWVSHALLGMWPIAITHWAGAYTRSLQSST